ncbi:hypothetical protein OHT68_47525 [Streptomyces canus]|uniref:hypothetical protein n=1 Tax=Streptomyces canus TaxID=58343 RepID=UPI002E2AB7E4|nr:hypothetical protein [Streptomyces canus]
MCRAVLPPPELPTALDTEAGARHLLLVEAGRLGEEPAQQSFERGVVAGRAGRTDSSPARACSTKGYQWAGTSVANR